MSLKDQVVAAMRRVYDPEMPVNIYELGLIYAVDVNDAGEVAIRMTLTAPACPAMCCAAGKSPATASSRRNIKCFAARSTRLRPKAFASAPAACTCNAAQSYPAAARRETNSTRTWRLDGIKFERTNGFNSSSVANRRLMPTNLL